MTVARSAFIGLDLDLPVAALSCLDGPVLQVLI